MLFKNISVNEIKNLSVLKVERYERIITPYIPTDIAIRASTEESTFFFEPQNTNSQLMRIYEYSENDDGAFFVSIGIKLVNYLFEIGEIISFTDSYTPKVTALALIRPEDLSK